MKGVIIFGASGGIGSQIARELSAQGVKLFLTGRDEERLSKLVGETEKQGTQAYYSTGDATQYGDVQRVFSEAKEALGDVTGIVNCVGSVLLKPAHRTSDKEWLDTVNTNLTSAFYIVSVGTQIVSRDESNPPSIVLFSTAASQIGLSNHDAISAAKGGINGLVLSASATYAPKKIRINGVAPGLVDTKLTEKITGNESSLKFSLKMHPLGRIGDVSDISSVVCFLLDSKKSGWITGQTITVDGGLSTLKS